jgi:uncharacterized membrane protein
VLETALAAVHVLAAAVWVGGVIVLVVVAVPYARSLAGEERAAALRAIGRRWRPLGWGALGVLALTGIELAAENGVFDGTADTSFTVVFAVKMGLVVALAAGAYLHDFVLGPALARQIRHGRPQSARRPLVVVGWTTFALTLTVPVLGVVLAHLYG